MARSMWRVALPPVATAVLGTGASVLVNLATEWKTTWWAWAAVAAVTVAAAVFAVVAEHGRIGSAERARRSSPNQSVSHSVIGGDNIMVGPAERVRIERGR